MKKLEKNKFYFLKILFHGRELEYNCKINFIDKKIIKISSEDGDCLTFDLKDVVHFHEIDDYELEPKIVVRNKRVPKRFLKKEEGPEF